VPVALYHFIIRTAQQAHPFFEIQIIRCHLFFVSAAAGRLQKKMQPMRTPPRYCALSKKLTKCHFGARQYKVAL